MAGLLGINFQLGNVALGVGNQSVNGNGLLAGVNVQVGNFALGALNQSFDGNGALVWHQPPDR